MLDHPPLHGRILWAVDVVEGLDLLDGLIKVLQAQLGKADAKHLAHGEVLARQDRVGRLGNATAPEPPGGACRRAAALVPGEGMRILVLERGARGKVLTAVGTRQVVIKVGEEALTKKEFPALIMPAGLGRLSHLGLSRMLLPELSRSHPDLYRPSLTCPILRLIRKVQLKRR